jgi:hypothetical protein
MAQRSLTFIAAESPALTAYRAGSGKDVDGALQAS